MRRLRAAADAAKHALEDHQRRQTNLQQDEELSSSLRDQSASQKQSRAILLASSPGSSSLSGIATTPTPILRHSRRFHPDDESDAKFAERTATAAAAAESAVEEVVQQLAQAKAEGAATSAAIASKNLAASAASAEDDSKPDQASNEKAASAATTAPVKKQVHTSPHKAHTTLWVHVSEARNLLPSVRGGSSSDSFVVLELVYEDSGLPVKPPKGFKNAQGSYAYKAHTKTAPRTLAPKWTDASAKVRACTK